MLFHQGAAPTPKPGLCHVSLSLVSCVSRSPTVTVIYLMGVVEMDVNQALDIYESICFKEQNEARVTPRLTRASERPSKDLGRLRWAARHSSCGQ